MLNQLVWRVLLRWCWQTEYWVGKVSPSADYLWQDDFLWLTSYNKMILCSHRNWGLSTNVTITSLCLAMLNSWVLGNSCKMGKWCPMCSIWKILELVCEMQWEELVDIKEEMPLLLWAASLQGFRNVQKGFSDLAHLGGESKLGTHRVDWFCYHHQIL